MRYLILITVLMLAGCGTKDQRREAAQSVAAGNLAQGNETTSIP